MSNNWNWHVKGRTIARLDKVFSVTCKIQAIKTLVQTISSIYLRNDLNNFSNRLSNVTLFIGCVYYIYLTLSPTIIQFFDNRLKMFEEAEYWKFGCQRIVHSIVFKMIVLTLNFTRSANQ